ncbi:hypothetical protein ACFZCK_04575 [Kitasatospora purpeofusca]|uniref:hypothetical protein n=1 Tax=Kitasatospora purpeofusca TaxID=67352 RepID=UPI0036E12638
MAVVGRVVSLALQAALVTGTGRSCGYGVVPAAGALPTGAAFPYSVLYPLGGTSDGPPFGDADADARLLYQVTSIGQSAEQAEWMGDKVRSTLLGRTGAGAFAVPITAVGHVVIGRSLDGAEGVTAEAGVYSYVERFVLHVTTPGS